MSDYDLRRLERQARSGDYAATDSWIRAKLRLLDLDLLPTLELIESVRDVQPNAPFRAAYASAVVAAPRWSQDVVLLGHCRCQDPQWPKLAGRLCRRHNAARNILNALHRYDRKPDAAATRAVAGVVSERSLDFPGDPIDRWDWLLGVTDAVFAQGVYSDGKPAWFRGPLACAGMAYVGERPIIDVIRRLWHV